MGVDTWEWALFTSFNSELPDDHIHCLTLGQHGEIWVGTSRGLARLHNGQWKIFNSQNSPMPNDFVDALATDQDGELWIGTGGGLARLHDGQWEIFNSKNSPLPGKVVTALATGQDGELWIGTGGSLVRLHDTHWKIFNSKNSPLPDQPLTALATGQDGEVWVGTFGGGIAQLHDGQWEIFNSQNSPLPDDRVRALTTGQNGEIWIGTSYGGLARLHHAQWQIFNSQNSPLPDDKITAVASGQEGELWIGILGGGLTRFQDAQWTTFNPQDSPLPDDFVTALTTGQEGEIWIGTFRGGLARLHPGQWKLINSQSSPLPNDLVRVFNTEHPGKIWIGTLQKGLAQLDDGGWHIFNSQNSPLPYDAVVALATDQDGEIWVGTFGRGLARLHDEKWKTFNSQNSPLPDDGVTAIASDQNGDTWVGTFRGGLARLHDEKWKTFNSQNSPLPSNSIGALAIGQDGEIWVGAGAGLARFHEGKWETYNSHDTPLPGGAVTALATSQDGGLWIGTFGGGLARLHDEQWKTFSPENSPLPDGWVSALCTGQDGEIWIGTAGGLARLHDRQWKIFDSRNSPLPDDFVRALAVDQDGELWVGTDGGVIHGQVKESSPHITLIGERGHIGQQEHMFAASAVDPSYRTALGMFRYEWNLKRLDLVGNSETVRKVTTVSPFFSVTDLRDGTAYELRVVALDQNGFRSNEVVSRFRVKLPKEEAGWLQTTLIRLLIFLAVYASLLLPLLTLYSRASWARTALNSGAFTKFPWFHKAVLNTGWARRQLFRSLAMQAIDKAEIPESYIPLTLIPTTENVSAFFDDKSAGRSLLLGRSGTGKSVLLQVMRRSTAWQFLEGEGDFAPVFIDLSGYPLTGKNIEDLIRDALRGAQVELPDDILDFLIRKGGFLLLFDSLNELPNPEEDALAFHPFFQRDSGNMVILASQVDVLQRQDLGVWRLAEVDAEQAQKYLHKETGKDVWDELPAAARDLARNPQDLALLAEVVTNLGAAEVPTERAALYREMLHQDSALKPWVDSGDPRLDVIYGLALRMVDEQRVLDDARLVEWLRAEIERAGIEADAGEMAEKIRASRLFRQEAERTALGRDEPVVTFRHELIGKFLASRRLRRDLERGEEVDAIVERAGSELWVEVFTFLLDELDSGEVLNGFLGRLVDAGGSARLRLVAHALVTREGDVAAEVQEAYYYAKVAEDVERPSRG